MSRERDSINVGPTSIIPNAIQIPIPIDPTTIPGTPVFMEFDSREPAINTVLAAGRKIKQGMEHRDSLYNKMV